MGLFNRASKSKPEEASSSSAAPTPESSASQAQAGTVVGKAASDILAPLDGEIVEVNEAIVEDPALVNSDPTGAAWFFKMKVPDTSAVDQFMDEDAYKALID